jgi:hypothetical protein
MFDIKFVIFSQEMLCKLSIFFTHRLASTKAYQKKIKVWGCHFENY